jgi:hypothetical protein
VYEKPTMAFLHVAIATIRELLLEMIIYIDTGHMTALWRAELMNV